MSTVVRHPPAPAGESHSTAKCIVLPDGVQIPLGIQSLSEFREWARSEEFPEKGRIDYIGGSIEVDLMVENLFYHGAPKAELAAAIIQRTRTDRSGRVFIDRTRITHPGANVSAEPDILFVSYDSIQSGRMMFIPTQDDDPESFIELEGSPDWVCEIVSKSSVEKDTVRLAHAYFVADVIEYWMADARSDELIFQIFKRGKESFVAVERDGEGYQESEVFGRRYRFSRERGPDNHWEYRLEERSLDDAR